MSHKATFRGADSITSNDPRQSREHCDVSRSKRLDRVADATPAGVDRYRPCPCRIFRLGHTDGVVRLTLVRGARALPSGRHAELARPCLVTSAYDSCCTTKQPNAHNTESRKLLYPWHPWHGHSVWVHRTMVKYGIAISFVVSRKPLLHAC